jgi:hypothetical protein
VHDTAAAREVLSGSGNDETMTEVRREHDTWVGFVFFCFGAFGCDTAITPLLSIVEQATTNQCLLLRIQQERRA